jgi:hypothetical protein
LRRILFLCQHWYIRLPKWTTPLFERVKTEAEAKEKGELIK